MRRAIYLFPALICVLIYASNPCQDRALALFKKDDYKGQEVFINDFLASCVAIDRRESTEVNKKILTTTLYTSLMQEYSFRYLTSILLKDSPDRRLRALADYFVISNLFVEACAKEQLVFHNLDLESQAVKNRFKDMLCQMEALRHLRDEYRIIVKPNTFDKCYNCFVCHHLGQDDNMVSDVFFNAYRAYQDYFDRDKLDDEWFELFKEKYERRANDLAHFLAELAEDEY